MKQKKLLAAFIAAAMAVTALPQTALAESEDFLQSEGIQPTSVVVGEGDSNLYEGFRYKELEDGTLSITGYEGTETDITIPAEINGQAVTVIGNGAFNDSEIIISVKIPDSVTSIENAFMRCDNLQTVDIPYSVVSISESAFQNCHALKSINVDDNNPEYKDEDGVLFTKDGETIILYPNDKTETSYTIPDGVITIGRRAFYGDNSLETINIPASVEFIDISVFGNCSSLAAINVDADNQNYKDDDGVLLTKDGKTLLRYPYRKSGYSYTIPDGVEIIASDSFSLCNLMYIKISEGVETIEERAFYNCHQLAEVEIPASVVSADGAFTMSCHALTSFIVDGDNPAYKEVDGILFSKDGSRIVRFPVGKSDTAYSIPADVKTISKYALADCRFTTVDIPVGVETIDDGAFLECRDLNQVVIPDGVKTIGVQAFDYCSSLISVTIPASVTEIYRRAFTSNSPDLIMYGYIGSCAEAYANENNIKFVYMDALTFTDEDTGIEINAGEDALPANTKLTVEQTAETDTEVSFDITLTCNGEEIQPEGNVTVRIPVPEGWDTENIYVYHRDANGRLTEIKATVSGGYIIFTTNHFSEYLLSTTKLVATTPCDVDGSGEVDELDSVALARYLASWNVAIDQSAADVDGNGDIDELDSVMLARKLAGWNV